MENSNLRLPTKEEFEKLLGKEYIRQCGHLGILFQEKATGNKIMFPYTGSTASHVKCGVYMTSTDSSKFYFDYNQSVGFIPCNPTGVKDEGMRVVSEKPFPDSIHVGGLYWAASPATLVADMTSYKAYPGGSDFTRWASAEGIKIPSDFENSEVTYIVNPTGTEVVSIIFGKSDYLLLESGIKKFKVPKITYWTIDGTGRVISRVDKGRTVDRELKEYGNYFLDKGAAEERAEEIRKVLSPARIKSARNEQK